MVQFLVSGLIDGDRQTELEATANVLQRIDSAAEDGLGELRRKLARGAMVTARLLAEGVLEQDRRVRAQLRNTLRAIYASSDPKVLEPLLRVRQPDSMSWLLDALIDALRELQPAEHVGAAAILARVLTETHPRFETVQGYLDAADPELLALILRVGSGGLSTEPFRSWFVRVLMRCLARPNSLTLSARGLNDIILELRRHSHDQLEILAREAGLSLDDSRLLQWLAEQPVRSQPAGKQVYGLVVLEHYPTDWTTGNVPRPAARITTEQGQGVLGLLYRIAAFARMKRTAELKALLAELRDVGRFAEALPPHIAAHIPVDFERDVGEQIRILEELDERDLTTMVKKQQVGGRPWRRPTQFVLSPRAHVSADQWTDLVSEWPSVALVTWSERAWSHVGSRPALLASPSATEVLVKRLAEDADALAHAPGLWGKLVDSPGGAQLRRHLVTTAKRVSNSAVRTELTALPLELPRDAPLLAPLLGAIFAGREPVKDANAEFSEVTEFVKGMTSIAALRTYRDTGSSLGREHLAACVLAWLHPDSEVLDEDSAALSFLSSSRCDEHLAKCVVGALTLLAQPNDQRACEIVSKTIDFLRNRPRDRDLLDDLIGRWRERSHAPVTSGNHVYAWLGIPPTTATR